MRLDRNVFLTICVEHSIPVPVFLSNSVRLEGKIVDFEDTCIFLKRDDIVQLVERINTSTILPKESISQYLSTALAETASRT